MHSLLHSLEWCSLLILRNAAVWLWQDLHGFIAEYPLKGQGCAKAMWDVGKYSVEDLRNGVTEVIHVLKL